MRWSKNWDGYIPDASPWRDEWSKGTEKNSSGRLVHRTAAWSPIPELPEFKVEGGK